MLHIILAILKLIGAILAIILLLLLILVLVVAFVPVRYRIEGARKEGQLPAGAGGVTWLGRMLAVSGEFRDGKPSVRVRILFWKKQLMGGETDSGDREERQENAGTPGKEQEPRISLRKEESKDTDDQKAAIITKTKHEKETGKAEDRTAEKKKAKGSNPSKISPVKKLADRLKAVWQMLKGIPDRIRAIIKSLTAGKEKAEEYLDILRSDPVKHVFSRFKGHLLYLLKHLGPRRMEGQLRYGFEDPATTGQLTGILYLLLTRKKFRVELQPDFDDQVLEGTLMIKGHIRFCHVVWVGIRVLLDKEFRGLLRKLRKKR